MRQVLCCLLVVAITAACGPDRNQPPTVDASASATEVAVGQEVTVDGSSSADPDGDPLLFRWTLKAPDESSVELDNPRTSKITFAPDVAGTYTVQLSVDDGEFESSLASVTVEATGTGAPVVDAGPDQSVEVGEEVTLDGSNSSDPNGDELTYQWSFEQKPQGSTAEFSDATVAQPSFVADVAGDFIVGLVVSDGEFTSEPDTVIVSVGGEGNQPPVADAGEDQSVDVGTEVTLDGSASSDADSSELTYFWQVTSEPTDSSVDLIDATEQIARFTPTHAGTYEFQLTVSDGDKTDTDSLSVVTETSVSSSCLLISEYIEGTSNNKAIELYNCDSASIDLSGFGFCIVANDNTTCTNYDIPLTGTLAQGEVFTLCHNSLDTTLLNDTVSCDVSDASVNFNGNDRIVVYEDVDDSGDFGQDDIPADVFGEIANSPTATAPWADVTYRRCNFGRFDGQSGFDYSAYFTEVESGLDDFSDFGEAPTEGCP